MRSFNLVVLAAVLAMGVTSYAEDAVPPTPAAQPDAAARLVVPKLKAPSNLKFNSTTGTQTVFSPAPAGQALTADGTGFKSIWAFIKGTDIDSTVAGSPALNGLVLTADGTGGASWVMPMGFSGVLPIANGGTGSSTKNFVDLTNNQTVAGNKTFSKKLTVSTAFTVEPRANNTGADNNFIGAGAGSANTTGSQNTFVGASAGTLNTTGIQNTILGSFAGITNTTGGNNVFLGQGAGNQNTTGGNNTFIGTEAGFSNTIGSNNIAVGRNAGSNLSTLSNNNILIGNQGLDEANTVRIGDFQDDTFLVGRVGINTNTFNVYQLTVAGYSSPALSLVNSFTGNSAEVGIAGDFLELSDNAAPDDLVIRSDSTAKVLIQNGIGSSAIAIKNNLVGIGTANPSKAKLEIGTTGGAFTTGTVSSLNSQGVGTSSLSNFPISLYCSSYAAASIFVAYSDARIKNIQGRSDSAVDLQKICAIEITDYVHKDVISRGNSPQKKVIAQQVEKVFPQAVQKSTDCIPDIYKRADQKDGWITLASDLKKGERVRIIGDKTEGVHEVLEVKDGTFRTAFKSDDQKVFVYGREVNDFRAVDYEAISMLNVSATQELAKQSAALKIENAELKKRLTDLEAKDKARDARLARMEKMLEGGETKALNAAFEVK